MHLPRALAAVSLAVLAAGPGASAAARRDAAAAWPGSVAVVGYRTPAALHAVLAAGGARVVRRLPALKVVALQPRGSIAGFARRIRRIAGVSYVERVAPRSPSAEPALLPATSFPGGAYEWQYAGAHVNAVPDGVLRAAKSMTIAVIDTGADLTAPDLAAKAPATWSLLTSTSEVRDGNGHGTFVSALAAGSVTNGEGIAGFGGDAKLLVIQAGDSTGNFTDVAEAAAIQYAVDHGARIVNLSLGGADTSSTEQAAIQYAVDHGVLLVAAVGNEFSVGNPVEYPAALLQPVGSNGKGGAGLSVGASTLLGSNASFSNTGSHLSLVAPGENVFGAIASTAVGSSFTAVPLPGSHAGLYGFASGTSFAAPEVAGAAALVWAANPLLTAQQVASILKVTATGHGVWNDQTGYGVIDVAAAVDKASNGTYSAVSVDLSGRRAGSKVMLSWNGTGATAYRVLMRQDDGPTRVLIPETTARSGAFAVNYGHAYVFTVAAIDATGAEASASKPFAISLARAAAGLALSATPLAGAAPLGVTMQARLTSPAGGPTPNARTLILESFTGGSWHGTTSGVTASGGRVVWHFKLRNGLYKIRARFSGSDDLLRATSPVVVLKIR